MAILTSSGRKPPLGARPSAGEERLMMHTSVSGKDAVLRSKGIRSLVKNAGLTWLVRN
jgi:hypothetical protein